MSVEWYDLAQRLYAATHGLLVPRLDARPFGKVSQPVAVRAHVSKGTVVATIALPGQGRHRTTASGPLILDTLAAYGVSLSDQRHWSLVTDDHATLPALHRLARESQPDGPVEHVAALIEWWADRADYPGTAAVVNVVDECRARWVAGTTPDAETSAATWRTWHGIGDESVTGVLALFARLHSAPTLHGLGPIQSDDAHAWTKAREALTGPSTWRTRDPLGAAAVGLRARCDAVEVHAAALLNDARYRRRAVHTGHVVHGVVTWTPGKTAKGIGLAEVACTRLDARLRPQDTIAGWIGHPSTIAPPMRLWGLVQSTSRGTDGSLRLRLSNGNIRALKPGQPVTLTAAPPSEGVIKAGRERYGRLYSRRTSWLTTGRTPTPHRRDVPLDVLIAGAPIDEENP